MVLDGPERCDSCDAAFCKSCISERTQTDKSCPSCQEEYVSHKLSKFKLEELLKLKFKWAETEKVYDYNAAFEQGKSISLVIMCLLGC